MESVFAVAPLGFEQVVLDELNEFEHINNTRIIAGGVNFETQEQHFTSLVRLLKTPNRLLWRVHNQKCRDLPKLFKIISKINWHKYLVSYTPNWHISCSESRLMHTGRIKDTCQSALDKYFVGQKLKASVIEKSEHFSAPQVFIRLELDNLTISIDLGGELLYRHRSLSFKGVAPLRNNFAAILLRILKQYSKEDRLIDPMCGSATFGFEALGINNREQYYCDALFPKLPIVQKVLFKEVLCMDINKQIVAKIKESNPPFDIYSHDIFSSTVYKQSAVVIINSPYGKKVKLSQPAQIYYPKLIQSCFEKFNTKLLGIIIPESYPLKLKAKQSYRLFNNGIWVKFYIISRS